MKRINFTPKPAPMAKVNPKPKLPKPYKGKTPASMRSSKPRGSASRPGGGAKEGY